MKNMKCTIKFHFYMCAARSYLAHTQPCSQGLSSYRPLGTRLAHTLFSSSEATLLLVSTKNRDLLEGPTRALIWAFFYPGKTP